jgi:hypothetical protein
MVGEPLPTMAKRIASSIRSTARSITS